MTTIVKRPTVKSKAPTTLPPGKASLSLRKTVPPKAIHIPANTCYTNHPESSYTHINEYVFRQLNVSDGVKITIEGGMSLNAVQTACGGGTRNIGGEPQGPFASVKLGKGATIDVKGQLYCWGFISDVNKNDGTVIVEDGGTLYESFFIGDCRGGNISYDIVEKVFPINQYYVQNVESKVVFRQKKW